MIREIIVTSPHGVRLAFEASGPEGLALKASGLTSGSIAVCDRTKTVAGPGDYLVVGVIPDTWLIELNEQVT